MAVWKRYAWNGFDATALTQVERVTNPADRQTALEQDFDPALTYVSFLTLEWEGHPRGSRVMMDTERLAIEQPARAATPGFAFKASC